LTIPSRADSICRMRMRWIGLLLSLGLLGCTSTEDRCEMLCQWVDKCEPEVEVTCSRADVDRCVEEYDAKSDQCQDVIDDVTDCIEEADESCDARERCGGKMTEYFVQCHT
jgi:hypothetical protein